MSSDVPTATWHPAFMPNSAADIAPGPADTGAAEPATSAWDEEATQKTDTATPRALEPLEVDHHDTSGVEDWFPEYESTSPWLEHSQPAPVPFQPPTAENNSHPIQPEDGDDEAAFFDKAANRDSTISFSRTVSHDVNGSGDGDGDGDGDDDEPEWDLPRTDTDPFKFMPPSDRTNSFPAVPVIERGGQRDEHPLPSSQAEEVMRDLDHQDGWDHGPEAPEQPETGEDSSPTHGAPNNGDFPQQYVGGDLMGSAEEGFDERYAEGIPLISHQTSVDIPDHRADTSRDPFPQDPFSQNDGDEDDFFNHVEASGEAVPDELPVQALERKSTMQVMTAITASPAGREQTVLEESDEAEGREAGDVVGANGALPSESNVDDGLAQPAEGKDLDAKWAAVFQGDDDDDFLADDTPAESKDVDFSAFLGDDDDGFLDDTLLGEQPAGTPSSTTTPAAASAPQIPAVNRYLPAGTAHAPSTTRQPSNPYFPNVAASSIQPPVATPFTAPPPSAPPVTTPFGYGAPPVPRPEANKAASFADKAKGGYQSPYDLPMEVAKPRKRQSLQQLPKSTVASAPPPTGPPQRSSSTHAVSPTFGPPSQTNPPISSNFAHPPAGAKPAPQAKKAENFFEELPMSAKVRPASRHSQNSLPSPSQTSPYGPPQVSAQGSPQISPSAYQSRPSPQFAPPNAQHPPQPAASDINKLVAPPRVNPYAPLQSSSVPQPVSLSSGKYSPAPPPLPQNAAVQGPPSNKYSPAPNGRLPSGHYQSAPPAVPPQMLPHQPRTSSPLAHFEISHDRARQGLASHSEGHLSDRRGSAPHYEARLNRVPSLPPTQELPDEDGLAAAVPTTTAPPPQATYMPHRSRHTPPPPQTHSTLSPQKRASAYSPQSQPPAPTQSHEFVPPQRSQTQSPGALYGSRSSAQAAEPIQRPSSVHDPTSPRTAAMAPLMPGAAPVALPSTRSRTFSQNFSFVAPTDGRERDPLQRWKGSPVISWGVGGTLVSSFPKSVPRYGMNQTGPTFIRSPGEVKIKSIKELHPLEERLLRFPGPLKGKSKKKEVVTWLSAGIESLERGQQTFSLSFSHEDKRSRERVLLWKVLRVLVEFDGVLEGSPAVDHAVRDVLNPRLDEQATATLPLGASPSLAPGFSAGVTQMNSDGVDSAAVEQVRASLLAGDRDKAVWQAADKRLWGHALLIASRTSAELFKQATQEFVRKEVNYPGHSNEPLAALYEVLSGNHEECVDELVPRHARMGRELMATTNSALPSKDALAGLDKWQETLALILSNRSADDARAISSLGNLLSEYGRAEAAHICFIFARHAAVFGGLDDPQSNFVLVGADHRRQANQFAKETEALLLSEVYEYGLSLGGSSAGASSPHLAAYKLQHALTLAEYGQRDKALQYCEAIASAITSQTRRSPYHHAILEAAVEDLMKRLRQAPKEESNSWIPKPSMNKVSDTVWNRFNKFVAGDDNDGSGPGSDAEGGAEAGPFARLAGGTPTISRPPSASGTTGMEMFGPPVHQAPAYPMANGPVVAPPTSRAASRYAPAAGQAAVGPNPYDATSAYTPPGRSSMERTSGEHSRSSYDLPRQSSELSAGYSPSYVPNNAAAPSPGYQDHGLISRESSYVPVSQVDVPTQPPSQAAVPGYEAYLPPSTAMNGSPYAPHEPPEVAKDEPPTVSGYQAPSYGYEPPSTSMAYEPTPPQADNLGVASGEEPTSHVGSSYQPYSYEPPAYSAPDGEDDDEPKPRKKTFMDDDEDDIPALRQPTDAPKEKSKEDKDRENAEMFRRAAEEDAKRADAEKAAKAKKGWGLTSWWGAGSAPKKEAPLENQPNKPIRAKLGEKNSFFFDPELKRWVNKNASPEDNAAKTATPPPPRSAPRSAAATPPPGSGAAPPPRAMPPLTAAASVPNLAAVAALHAAPPPFGAGPRDAPSAPPATGLAAPPPLGPSSMMRSASNTSVASGPPSRPPTSMSTASSIDDLLGPAGPRKAGAKKAGRKGGRYVDVMAK